MPTSGTLARGLRMYHTRALMKIEKTSRYTKQEQYLLEEMMNRILSVVTMLAVLGLLSTFNSDTAYAQTGKQSAKGAMHEYGPFDEDGDGIPNGQDPDFVKPKDGSGHKFGQTGNGNKNSKGQGNSYGPGKGNGLGSGSGTCDGTGPKGKGRGR